MEPKIAQKGSYEFEVEEGKSYKWCSCGLSKKQPLCDSSHRDTGIKPIVFTAEKSETIYVVVRGHQINHFVI